MHSLTLLAFVFDEGFASIFSSPFIVPVFGTLMVLGIVVAGIWSGVRRREMESQERLAAIAKGIALPPTPGELASDQSPRAAANVARGRDHSRKTGLILTFVGIGMMLFGLLLTWIERERDVLTVAATGLVPLAIGIGFLIDAHLKSRDLERANELGGGSELRPLH